MTQTYATLGALLALPVFTVITLLCWSTGAIPTAIMTTLMWSGTLALCAWDYERLAPLFRAERSLVQSSPCVPTSPASPEPIELRPWTRCGATVLLLYLASCALAGGIYRPRGLDLQNPSFYVLPLIACLPLATWWWQRRRRGQNP